jgi:hypothetical protein
MICSACEEYATVAGELCGNCVILQPADLKQVYEQKEAKKQLAAGANPSFVIASLQQQVNSLKAENESLRKQIDELTTPPIVKEPPKTARNEPVFRT